MLPIEIYRHVFWYQWVKRWPLHRFDFFLLIAVSFAAAMMIVGYVFEPEHFAEVFVLRLAFGMSFAITITAPVLLARYLENDAREVITRQPELTLQSATLSRTEGFLTYLAGVAIGCSIGMVIEGWSYFVKIGTEPTSFISSVGLALIMGPGIAFQYYGSHRLCRWLANAADGVEVDLLQTTRLEVFVRPLYRLVVLLAVTLGVVPLFLFANSLLAYLVLAMALFAGVTMLPLFLQPTLAIRKQVIRAKENELELIRQYFAGEHQKKELLRPASLGTELRFAEVLAWEDRVENIMAIPIGQSFKRATLLFLLPLGSWAVAIGIELLF